MTKQEEIREGLAEELCKINGGIWNAANYNDYWLEKADGALSYLHSQGVVIKVERELPENSLKTLGGSFEGGYLIGQQDIIKTFLEIWNYKGNKDAVSMTPEEIMDKITQRMKEQAEQLKQAEEQERLKQEEAKKKELTGINDKVSKLAVELGPDAVDEVLSQ